MDANGTQVMEPADAPVPLQPGEIGYESAEEPSALASIRARREELRQERHIDIDVPGYRGELVIRFRPVEWDQLRAIGRKHEGSKSPRKELLAQADTLLAACGEVFIRVDGDLEAIKLGGPTRFDGLPAALEFDAETARQTVFGTFNNDLAVTAVHNELVEWMAGADEETDDDLVGE